MNRFALLVIASLAALAASPRVADAQWWRPRWHTHYPGCGHATSSSPPPSAQVPELDPNAAAAALTVLAGGALLIRDRRRRLVG